MVEIKALKDNIVQKLSPEEAINFIKTQLRSII